MMPMDTGTQTPADEIQARFHEMQDEGDWRGAVLAHVRALIIQADPDVLEEIKWRKASNPGGVPTYSHDGLIGTLEHYKDKVKFTFARGNEIDDPTGLFTGGFGGKRRVIDFFEADEVDEEGFQGLIRAAVRVNGGT